MLTGKKWDQKVYTWTTGYPGLRTETARTRFERDPASILTEAVRRMLPKNKLATKMLDKLKVYAGDQHPHQAQNPAAQRAGDQVRHVNARSNTRIPQLARSRTQLQQIRSTDGRGRESFEGERLWVPDAARRRWLACASVPARARS